MTYPEFLDELKIISYSCPQGLIMNSLPVNLPNPQVIPTMHVFYEGIRGPVSFEECIEHYKQWAKEINEKYFEEHGLSKYCKHDDYVKSAKERFKLEKENPGEPVYKDSTGWHLLKDHGRKLE